MKYLVMSFSLGVLLFSSSAEAQFFGSSNQAAGELSKAAKEEMTIIGRLQNLRKATEKLPAGWRVKAEDGKRVITKEGLLYEVETLEVMAAERWNHLIRSMALYENKDADSRNAIQANIQSLDKLQVSMNKRLDYFNKRLKTGILMKLAAEVEKTSGKKKRTQRSAN